MERFSQYFVPEHYELKLHFNREKTKFSGKVTILGEAQAPKIKLHAVNLRLKSLQVDSVDHSFRMESDAIIINDITPGKHKLYITYDGDIKRDMVGVYRSVYEFKDARHKNCSEAIIATQFESHYARRCFPCIDEPSAKAKFSITISSANLDDQIISNMPALKTVQQKQLKTVTFATTPRMSSYLLAFALGSFQSYAIKSKSGVQITSYAGLHQDSQLLKYPSLFAAKCIDFYNELFKLPFPLPKLDQLALPDFEAGAMENWGLMTFREHALLADAKSAVSDRAYVATVIAHEISHMWFGDLVTMAWWDDLWLNEAFACLMETYAVAKIDPSLEVWDDFYTDSVLPALLRDSLPNVQPVRVAVHHVEDIANLFDASIVYAKGARLMLMLMRLMGEQQFFKGIASYFKTHAYKNTTADDLWRALSPYADFDVKAFMTPWLEQSGYPVLSAGKQQRFLTAGAPDLHTKYPVLKARDDLSGHYLIKLSDQEFALKLENFAQLQKEQQLRLIIDRWLLARANQVPSVSLVDLIIALNRAKDPLVWSLLSSIIADLSRFFAPDSDLEKQYKNFICQQLHDLKTELGIDFSSSDNYKNLKLRSCIYALLSWSDDPDFAATIYKEYIKNDISTKSFYADINPNYRSIILVQLAKKQPNFAEKFWQDYQASSDPSLRSDLMSALCAAPSQDLITQLLSSLKDENRIRPQDRLLFFIRLLKNPKARDASLDWFYDNWDFLFASEGDKSIADYPRYLANLINTPSEISRYREFFADKQQAPALQRTLKIAFAELSARLQLIADNQPAVQRKISELQ